MDECVEYTSALAVINTEEPRCLGDRDYQVRHFLEFRADAQKLGIGVQDGNLDTSWR